MSDFAAPRDLDASAPNSGEESGLAGGMGVSSERVGKARGEEDPTTHGTEKLDEDDPENPYEAGSGTGSVSEETSP